MTDEFIFRYNGDMANVVEEHDEDGMTYHELLCRKTGCGVTPILMTGIARKRKSVFR